MFDHVKVVRPAQRRVSAWANGGGTTSEIARGVNTTDGRPLWRLSVAALTGEAEFSALPGVDRIFTIIGTAAVRLSHHEETIAVKPLTPISFGGETPWHCSIEGETEALNVMTARGRVTATASASEVGEGSSLIVAARSNEIVGLMVVSGSVRADLVPLGPGDCAVARDGSCEVRGSATLIITHLTIHHPSLVRAGGLT